jgi:hypothetical protein
MYCRQVWGHFPLRKPIHFSINRGGEGNQCRGFLPDGQSHGHLGLIWPMGRRSSAPGKDGCSTGEAGKWIVGTEGG